MKDTVIRVEGLSKRYRVGERILPYQTLRDAVAGFFSSPFKGLKNKKKEDNFIWALKDVSLEVKRGEILGIIGRNGAGKTTLLKILSGITSPTEGFAEIRGRVGTLLEIGSGFHPELTGRENIYLYGSILGMKKREIERKFDEIVSFAEVEKFLDTPVKFYSSGMYLRLAFAVAAHLEPEILLVDEVLAVGDAVFQKKCLGKMGEVGKEGRTILFVSHNLGAIEHLCGRVILLDSGKVKVDSKTHKVIAEYLNSFSPSWRGNDLTLIRREPGLLPVIQKVEFFDRNHNRVTAVATGAPLIVHIHYKYFKRLKDPYFGLIFETLTGVRVFWVQTRLQKGGLPELPPSGVIQCRIPRLPLVPGTYFVQVGCGSGIRQLDIVPRACQLQVIEADVFGTGRVPSSSLGLVLVDADWEIVPETKRATH